MKGDYAALKAMDQPMAFNRGEELQKLDVRRQKVNVWVIGLALTGILIAVIENELLWHNRNIPVMSFQLIKLLNSGVTLILFYSILQYYAVEFELLEVSGKTVMGTSYLQAFILSGLLRPFLIETAIILIHPLPFVNYIVHIWGLDTYCAYSSDGFVTVFMMLRLYHYTPRIIAEASGLRNEKTRLIGLMNNVDISYHFIGKAMLRDSLLTLLFLFIVSVVTLAYATIVFERPIGPDTNLDLFENSVWLVIITMTTVGYGDIYPKTPMGRYVAIFAALLAVVLVALAVGAVTDRLTLSRDESKVLEFIENIRSKQERKSAAAQMLQHAWRAYQSQLSKKHQKGNKHAYESGVGENNILYEPLFYKAALHYSQMRAESVNGISTDVALTVTENAVGIKHMQNQMEELERKLTDMHNMIKTAVLGGASTKSTKW
ncbi:hypothetical protein GUITHDRAFT_110850 [Guillardia theta CCMP2712]|uniref:Potassium channel domain-containing protein n=2 Tax=Guillardia theta TaxID=55529 RepID=L1J3M7_GUITC|nr:hypothetical protein GUITHDRAFT_110850 [Guillardia theta CCMP2712]EKX43121.1 hypothetical protein GUITHDRAFT_110850 [Guillardia theta CCMP2712]|mmetsp:Transcript_40321/g.126914  ORF Transcript_40321/g.126914 Transcript_40321/m.126914 type:complete len:432 (+) Transcript_40321:36-1331(+)|eukprot:XP_005830101.1 hypothetical protein GUITHDRAFT_110850 [Guillardia theta CCMP2712]